MIVLRHVLRAKSLEIERNASSFIELNVSDTGKLPYEMMDVKTVFLQCGTIAVGLNLKATLRALNLPPSWCVFFLVPDSTRLFWEARSGRKAGGKDERQGEKGKSVNGCSRTEECTSKKVNLNTVFRKLNAIAYIPRRPSFYFFRTFRISLIPLLPAPGSPKMHPLPLAQHMTNSLLKLIAMYHQGSCCIW